MMQILEIVLYSKDGKKRVIPLTKNKVNIIIGLPRTGKSVLGNIVEYVLGKNECNVAEGVVRDNVSWFGLKIQFQFDQAFIARENPGYGVQSTGHSYLEFGNEIESPQTKPNKPNTTHDAIVDFLSKKIGISPNKTEPKIGQTQPAYEANIKHTFFYCFQEQDEIATKKFLFHNQSESWARDTIKATLPYFLGIVQEDRLKIINELNYVKRAL
jgi:hypothetical protein